MGDNIENIKVNFRPFQNIKILPSPNRRLSCLDPRKTPVISGIVNTYLFETLVNLSPNFLPFTTYEQLLLQAPLTFYKTATLTRYLNTQSQAPMYQA